MSARAAALPRALWARSRRTVNRSVLQRIELLGSDDSDSPLAHRPLLIVGAPRSGSTLLYQLVVQRFDVTYLGNRHCSMFGAPSLVERFGGRSATPPADFASQHGLTAGAWGPSECGPFWYRFFRKSPQFVPVAETRPDDLRRLRAAVRALGDSGGRSLVFKNLLCALRLEPIARAMPEARFVVIQRDLLDHARSILVARLRANSEAQTWWSVEPPGWERLRELEPAEQVIGQVEAIHAEIERAREQIGADRFLDVTYEQLIDDVPSTLDSVGGFARTQGIALEPRAAVPSAFPRPSAGTLPAPLEESLVALLEARR